MTDEFSGHTITVDLGEMTLDQEVYQRLMSAREYSNAPEGDTAGWVCEIIAVYLAAMEGKLIVNDEAFDE